MSLSQGKRITHSVLSLAPYLILAHTWDVKYIAACPQATTEPGSISRSTHGCEQTHKAKGRTGLQSCLETSQSPRKAVAKPSETLSFRNYKQSGFTDRKPQNQHSEVLGGRWDTGVRKPGTTTIALSFLQEISNTNSHVQKQRIQQTEQRTLLEEAFG